jgi:hypothetical protein
MMKFHNVLLACALGAGSLLGAAAPASAAHVSVGTARPAATGRVLPGNRYYGTGYRGYGYRYGYGYPYRYGYGYPYRYGYGYGYPYPYRYGYGYPYGVGIGIGIGYGYVGGGYGYVGGGYGYAPYPAVYGRRAYWVRGPYWRPYRRAYWGRRFVP